MKDDLIRGLILDQIQQQWHPTRKIINFFLFYLSKTNILIMFLNNFFRFWVYRNALESSILAEKLSLFLFDLSKTNI
jgi:hypothetical protein